MSTEAITQSIISEITAPAVETEETVDAPISNDPDFSQRLSILAKKEKGLLTRQQEIQQRLREIEEKDKKYKDWEESESLFDKNPTEYFKKKGKSFEDIQQKMLESMQDDDLDPIQKQIKELQQKLAAKDDEVKKILSDTLSDRDKKAQETQLEEQSKYYNQELKKHITAKSEEYDLITTFDASEEVFNVIKNVYLKTAEAGSPRLMSFDEACTLYEKKLEDMVGGMRKSKKVSKIFGSESEEDPFGQVSGQTTLDDSFSQSSSNSPDYKTEHERLKAAAKLFEQQLKG